MSDELTVLAAELGAAAHVDDIALSTLRSVVAMPGVLRAGLALTVVGGRQLRFVSSDADRLGPPVQWCLIDAYDRLPLNDAIRSGEDVKLPTVSSFRASYPELAARQLESGDRGVVAVPLADGDRRLGGLVLYVDADGATPTLAWLDQLKREVTAALLAEQAERHRANLASVGHRLPADETAPALARRHLRRTLNEWEIEDDVVDTALLCVSELVTNVVMHARVAPVVGVDRTEEAVTVTVLHAAESPRPSVGAIEETDILDIAGRGLALVEALAADWGMESAPGLTRAWFRLALTS